MTRHLRAETLSLRLTAGFLFASSLGAAAHAQQSRTYTLDADFDEGALVSVNHTAVHDQLQLDTSGSGQVLPFVAIPTSTRGTLVRIDANTGQILGEYRTAPNDPGVLFRNPSRTSVDSQGNVWVGNRDETTGGMGSVVKIGVVIGGTRVNQGGAPDPMGEYLKPPFQYSTCVDRDGDGLIRTSRGLGNILGWPNVTDGAGGPDGLVMDALDECILIFQRTSGVAVRHVSVDANDDVWVGGFPDAPTFFDKLSGANGAVLATFAATCGGHGGNISPLTGRIWSTSLYTGDENVLRYDPVANAQLCIPVARPHGLAIDNNGFVWVAQYDLTTVTKLDPSGNIVPGFPKPSGSPVPAFDRSITVTPADNNVWVAHSFGGSVSRLDNDGNLRELITLPNKTDDPRGVSVDSNGKVWVANFDTNTAMRIDPNGGPHGLGGVDLTVALGRNASPYAFNDFTGEVPLAGAQPNGSWNVVYDSGVQDTEFGKISWNGSVPANTSLVVEFRASNSTAGLPALPFSPATNGQAFSGVFGRFVEVAVRFQRANPSVTASPVLFDLTIESLGGTPPPTECSSGHRLPSSLLVFPEYDNRSGVVTLLTVTNTNEEFGKLVDVEYVYVGRIGSQGQLLQCNEVNRTDVMSPDDTTSVLTLFHNPSSQQGYVYVFAKDHLTHQPIVHNFLIGNQLMLRAIDNLEYSNNAVGFLGIGENGTPTDHDHDGVRDLNNVEYGCSPDRLLVPRFFGQDDVYQSELVLLNLTGGTPFVATIDFLIYNDNEEVFSSQWSFQCWERVPLLDITNAFSASFLRNFTNHSFRELVGAPGTETGWFSMNGLDASSVATTIQDPAFLALLIERAGGVSASDLPFEIGGQFNGDLLLRGILGDTTP